MKAIVPMTANQHKEVEKYIFECIDFENYGLNPESKKEKIALLIETFKNEFWNEFNKHRYKQDIKNGFFNWLAGLPSCFNVDFENHKILEIGKSWGFDLSTEKKQDQFIENWFKMVTNSVFYLKSKL